MKVAMRHVNQHWETRRVRENNSSPYAQLIARHVNNDEAGFGLTDTNHPAASRNRENDYD